MFYLTFVMLEICLGIYTKCPANPERLQKHATLSHEDCLLHVLVNWLQHFGMKHQSVQELVLTTLLQFKSTICPVEQNDQKHSSYQAGHGRAGVQLEGANLVQLLSPFIMFCEIKPFSPIIVRDEVTSQKTMIDCQLLYHITWRGEGGVVYHKTKQRKCLLSLVLRMPKRHDQERLSL